MNHPTQEEFEAALKEKGFEPITWKCSCTGDAFHTQDCLSAGRRYTSPDVAHDAEIPWCAPLS